MWMNTLTLVCKQACVQNVTFIYFFTLFLFLSHHAFRKKISTVNLPLKEMTSIVTPIINMDLTVLIILFIYFIWHLIYIYYYQMYVPLKVQINMD